MERDKKSLRNLILVILVAFALAFCFALHNVKAEEAKQPTPVVQTDPRDEAIPQIMGERSPNPDIVEDWKGLEKAIPTSDPEMLR